MNYRKKPVIIQAVKWTGENADEMASFMGVVSMCQRKIKITTLEGVLTADIGDWIIKGIKGEFYPCKSDIFEATYEAVP